MPEKGFFGSLFDVSFSSLITTKVIKVVYIITLVVIGLATLLFVISAFAQDTALGILSLFILGPIVALLYTIYARVLLEFVIVVFRIMETNVELVELGRRDRAPAAPAAASAPETPGGLAG